MEKDKKHFSSGSHSINIGEKNSVAHSNFHIGDVNNYRDNTSEPTAVIYRSQLKLLKVAGKPVNAAWLVVSGIVGFTFTIYDFLSYPW
jgi:hypothetical protein